MDGGKCFACEKQKEAVKKCEKCLKYFGVGCHFRGHHALCREKVGGGKDGVDPTYIQYIMRTVSDLKGLVELQNREIARLKIDIDGFRAEFKQSQIDGMYATLTSEDVKAFQGKELPGEEDEDVGVIKKSRSKLASAKPSVVTRKKTRKPVKRAGK